MKKNILAVVVLVLTIVSLPSIGNSFIKNSIDERLLELKSFGLQTSKDESISTYFNTSRHFEFLLKDSQVFLNHLKQYSDKQIPPYANSMLEGVLIGADIKYSNLPFAKAFEIEIYPMKLSPKMSEVLKDNDINFYKYTENFLQNKGVLYHIEYNLLNEDFRGYIKDINEKQTLRDGTKLMLSLENANFKGNGELHAPNELSSKVKELHFDISLDEKNLNILLSKFKSTSILESENTYISSLDVQTMLVTLEGTGNDVNISMEKLRANASSNEEGKSIQFNSKTSIKSLEFSSKLAKFNMKNFNIDVALRGLDKQEYSHFAKLLSQNSTQVSTVSNAAIETSITKLLSKGIVLEIANFSVDEFSRNRDDTIKGFNIKSKFTLKEDKDLAQKRIPSPFVLIPNISIESEIRISKTLYKKLKNDSRILEGFNGYEKEDGDDYTFTLKFADMQASINGKSIN